MDTWTINEEIYDIAERAPQMCAVAERGISKILQHKLQNFKKLRNRKEVIRNGLFDDTQ